MRTHPKWILWVLLIVGLSTAISTRNHYRDKARKTAYQQNTQLNHLDSLIQRNELEAARYLISELSNSDFNQKKEDNIFIRWLFLQGKYHYYAQEYPLAADFMKQAEIEVYEIDEPVEHQLYYLLERCYYHMGSKHFRALFSEKYLKEAVQEDQYRFIRTKLLMRIAGIYFKDKKQDLYEDAIEKADSIARDLNDPSLIIQCGLIRNAFNKSRTPEQKLAYLESLKHLVSEMSPPIKNTYYKQISDIHYFKLKDMDQANSNNGLSLDASKHIPDHHERLRKVSENFILLSDSEIKLGDFESAAIHLDSAMKYKDYIAARWVPYLYGNKLETLMALNDNDSLILDMHYQSIAAYEDKSGAIHKGEMEALNRFMAREVNYYQRTLKLVKTQRNLFVSLSAALLAILFLVRHVYKQILIRRAQDAEIKSLRAQLAMALIKPKVLIHLLKQMTHDTAGAQQRVRKAFGYLSGFLSCLVSGEEVRLTDELETIKNYLSLHTLVHTNEKIDFNAELSIDTEVVIPKLFILSIVDYLVRCNSYTEKLGILIQIKNLDSTTLKCIIKRTGFSEKRNQKGNVFPILERYLLEYGCNLEFDVNEKLVLHIPFDKPLGKYPRAFSPS